MLKSDEFYQSILKSEKIIFEDQDYSGVNGIYTLGILSSPKFITVPAQRARGKYIADAICKLSKNKRILIIGAGFGGISIANKFISNIEEKNLNHKVSLVEKGEYLAHLQRGCHTRRIHFDIHNWPKYLIDKDEYEKTSDYFEDNLPIKGTAGEFASNVSRTLIKNNFKKEDGCINIYESVEDLIFKKGSDSYRVIFNGYKMTDKFGAKKISSINENFDIIIFATGFGYEKRIKPKNDDERRMEDRFHSYWRNDSISQTPLYKKSSNYLISGAGDGAINDLLRLMLLDFGQDLTIKKYLYENIKNNRRTCIEMSKFFSLRGDFNSFKSTNCLKYLKKEEIGFKELNSINKSFQPKYNLLELFRDLKESNKDLFKKLELLYESGLLEEIKMQFLPIINKNRKVTILAYKSNEKNNDMCDKISFILNSKNIIFYNKILFYLVWKFTLNQVEVELSNKHINNFSDIKGILEKKGIRSRNVIIRHGSDKYQPILKIFKDSGFDMQNKLKEIEKQREKIINNLNIKDYLVGKYDESNSQKDDSSSQDDETSNVRLLPTG